MKALMRLPTSAVLVAGVTALVVELGRRCNPLTLAHCQRALDAVPEQVAEPLLAHFGSTGEAAIPILVEAALRLPAPGGAGRTATGAATEIDHWKMAFRPPAIRRDCALGPRAVRSPLGRTGRPAGMTPPSWRSSSSRAPWIPARSTPSR